MPSDDERREVAARLRNDVSESECIDYAVFRIIHDVLGIEDATSAKAAHVLADLIDRPTCQMVECTVDHGSRSWGMRCTACGKEFERMKPGFGWRFCPNCGAVVTEKEEDNG